MSNPTLTKNYDAGAAVPIYSLVKFGANDYTVIPATAVSDRIIGVADILGAEAAGERLDVNRAGIVPVVYGGTVTRGDKLTSNATGQAITSTADTDKIIGFAEISGVLNDIGAVLIQLS
jgi:hypothetical protein